MNLTNEQMIFLLMLLEKEETSIYEIVVEYGPSLALDNRLARITEIRDAIKEEVSG